MYNLAFKGAKWLRKVIPGIDVTVGDASDVSPFLTASDANNDNMRGRHRLWGIYWRSYNSSLRTFREAATTSAADFNCDGSVDNTDFALLRRKITDRRETTEEKNE